MFIHESNEGSIPNRSEAYYEEVDSQEEIYLEETEEELRMIFVSDDSPPSRSEIPINNKSTAEELIIGDSDDPPLSEEAVREMLRMI